MGLRLQGGRGRGFVLEQPPADITRPTSALLKRKLYDWRQHWQGQSFIDLCAGSGSMGLEALSRGAERVWLNELSRVSFRVLEKNVQKWHQQQGLLEGQDLELTQLDFRHLLKANRQASWFQENGSVLFFDPPWERHEFYVDFWHEVQGFRGEIWLVSDQLKGLDMQGQLGRFREVIKQVTQGEHWVLVGRL